MQYRINEDTGCWEWLGKKRGEYGALWVEGRRYSAHRYYYEQRHGPVAKHLHIDHLCRNPSCVNPDHLEPVYCAENIHRGASCELNWDLVDEIRTRYATENISQKRLAKEYGVTQTCIQFVVEGRRWKVDSPVDPNSIGRVHPTRKPPKIAVTPEIADIIRSRYIKGEVRLKDLAIELSLSIATVQRVVTGVRRI